LCTDKKLENLILWKIHTSSKLQYSMLYNSLQKRRILLTYNSQ
jgi:hypothetical protein